MKIKFNAYNSKLNEIWDYDKLILNGIYLAPSTGKLISIRENDFLTALDYLKPLMFINSHDSDGNEIFDGDMLISPSKNTFYVFWHEDQMRWAIKDTIEHKVYNLNSGLYKKTGKNIYQHETID